MILIFIFHPNINGNGRCRDFPRKWGIHMRYHLAGGFSWNRLKDDRSVYGSGIPWRNTFARNQCQWARYPSAIIPGIIRQMPKDRKTRKREEDRGEEKGRNRQRVVSSVGKVDTWSARSSKVSSMLTDLSIGSPRTISLSIPFRFFDSLKFFPSTWTSLLLLQLDREIGTSSQNRRSSPFMRFFF